MKGLLPIILTIIMAVFTLTEGNWYGKRGNNVDSVFKRYLQEQLENSVDRSLVDTDQTLRKIRKILDAWEENKNFQETSEEENSAYKK